ncbi:alpha-ketoglutarate-dependent dioxygenase AlkB family protein [Neisseria wadsworthii]|uniref:Alkylated DNA repair protein n=1 Tax=Neisseria wadsworthii 9715 TaxID=1030841 RepID=G4CS93_9NEIS|nr:alpha-ketoglutarate-dependent dioxygenase AlkB [Neisseria wadsworthii]EGZ44838.1 alkylated DNA repair protein [Neisseria wadsworthii 9715]
MMNYPELFLSLPQPECNLLPYDGIVNDYGIIFSKQEADAYYACLKNTVSWRHDEVVIYGKRITTARQTAWYGDDSIQYAYSGVTRTALPWNTVLLAIKETVERHIADISPAHFNSCLLNLYTDGSEGMAWHCDDEASLGTNPVIASLSLGAARKFSFKHKQTREKLNLMLTHGQLIVMHGTTQNHWLHAVMKSTKVNEPRINLTFRTICS